MLRISGVLVLVLASGLAAQTGPARRLYADGPSGVSFSYPANWLLNADDDAATAKLRIVSEAQPVAVVQLEGNFADAGPYKGTDFEAGAFAYVVSPRKTAEHCYEALDPIAGDEQKPMAVTWNGLAARRLEAKYSVAGTEDSHEIVATYRRGRCYLFETVIVSQAVDALGGLDGPTKALAPARWRMIRAQFAGVLGSVRIAGSSGKGP
ncbi:hypothetical protein [Granulicella arctica]|uniref:hypothetical protein n=1 Tax=Granulicella arctica TaxID=940613 RepID=UPI0021E04FE3|nr:hypothetical protein [Granulicella arctica]